ncbi:hypothetical protein PMI14_02872 [Acidovorax sp. CF316]|uniref:hypothetical protein n=1 Tax=Acidovorax sp. CF316 TaxID=1144317 RepID=UPI00026BE4BA|nr:hypothetical protein [Acidovorax sp. CF316]EJE52453.1 hypothetical protein PMI14_02872 [Acidovorax sp. CF316]
MKPLIFVRSLLESLRTRVLQVFRPWSPSQLPLRAPALVRVHSTQREHPRRRYRYRD